MSGGKWNYIQDRLFEIIEDIEDKINKNGKRKTNDELKLEYWNDSEHYDKYPETLNHNKYTDEVIKEFKNGLEIIKKAHIYIEELDLLFSGDNNEESFLETLNEELKKL